jgi:hypothetical protein
MEFLHVDIKYISKEGYDLQLLSSTIVPAKGKVRLFILDTVTEKESSLSPIHEGFSKSIILTRSAHRFCGLYCSKSWKTSLCSDYMFFGTRNLNLLQCKGKDISIFATKFILELTVDDLVYRQS